MNKENNFVFTTETITSLQRNNLFQLLSQFVKKIRINNISDVFIYAKSKHLHKIIQILCLTTSYKYKTLNDIVAIDFPFNTKYRFQCVYILSSLLYINRILIKVDYQENQIVDSITSIFTCAEWYEREIWDLYGLWFKGHPNLRRILNDYGYRDYPFRKDYPLNGYIQLQYNTILNSVIIYKLTSLQEFRVWDFQSPWISESVISETVKKSYIEEKKTYEDNEYYSHEEQIYSEQVQAIHESYDWEMPVFSN